MAVCQSNLLVMVGYAWFYQNNWWYQHKKSKLVILEGLYNDQTKHVLLKTRRQPYGIWDRRNC